MADEKRKLTVAIEGDGVDVSTEIDERQMLDIMAIAFRADSSPSKTAGTELKDQNGGGRRRSPKRSIGEFFTECGVSNNPERIAAIALYVEEHYGKDRIEKSEIPEWFERARVAAPKNLPRDIGNAIKRELVAEPHENDDAIFVTEKGKKAFRSEA